MSSPVVTPVLGIVPMGHVEKDVVTDQNSAMIKQHIAGEIALAQAKHDQSRTQSTEKQDKPKQLGVDEDSNKQKQSSSKKFERKSNNKGNSSESIKVTPSVLDDSGILVDLNV